METAPPPLILRVLATCCSAGRKAAEIIVDMVFKHNDIYCGMQDDLRTAATRAAETHITGTLAYHFPGLRFGGEIPFDDTEIPQDCVGEPDKNILSIQCPAEYEAVTLNDILLWINALEGTADFNLEMREQLTVMIGISVKGKAVAGVIHQPFYHSLHVEAVRTIWGLVGYGVAGLEPRNPPLGHLTLLTNQYDTNNTAQKQALHALTPGEIIEINGLGYQVMLLVEGKAHACLLPSNVCAKCDTCAVEAILKAAGGKLTDIHGNEYSYDRNVQYKNSAGVFATAKGLDHEFLVFTIPPEVKSLFV